MNKEILFKNQYKQNITFTKHKNEWLEIKIEDYAKKNIKTFITIVEKEDLKKLKDFLNEKIKEVKK